MSQMPDKIWLHKDTKYNTGDIVCGYQYEFAQEIQCEGIENFVEYIRKDIVDDMLATAEDHAYFAGSENTREKLKEEANKEYVAGYKAAKEECLEPYQLGFKNGKERTFEKACESYCKVCLTEGCKGKDCIWLNRFKHVMKGE